MHRLDDLGRGHSQHRNLRGVGTQLFKCYDSPFFDSRACDDEGIGVSSTFQDLLFLDVLLEMGDLVNSRYEGAFVGTRHGKQLAVLLRPISEACHCAILGDMGTGARPVRFVLQPLSCRAVGFTSACYAFKLSR